MLLIYFAPEHGKGPCDGESAVIKRFIRWFFKKGSLVVPLDRLVALLTENLSVVTATKRLVHSVHQRKFFSVHCKFSF
jgi:hypothetical protein